MERAETPVINDELVSTAELNERAPKPKKQRLSRQRVLKWLKIKTNSGQNMI